MLGPVCDNNNVQQEHIAPDCMRFSVQLYMRDSDSTYGVIFIENCEDWLSPGGHS